MGEVDAGGEGPAVAVVVDLPSGRRIGMGAPKQQPEGVGVEVDADHLGRWCVLVGDLVGEGPEGKVDEFAGCGCGGRSQSGFHFLGGGWWWCGDRVGLTLS